MAFPAEQERQIRDQIVRDMPNAADGFQILNFRGQGSSGPQILQITELGNNGAVLGYIRIRNRSDGIEAVTMTEAEWQEVLADRGDVNSAVTNFMNNDAVSRARATTLTLPNAASVTAAVDGLLALRAEPPAPAEQTSTAEPAAEVRAETPEPQPQIQPRTEAAPPEPQPQTTGRPYLQENDAEAAQLAASVVQDITAFYNSTPEAGTDAARELGQLHFALRGASDFRFERMPSATPSNIERATGGLTDTNLAEERPIVLSFAQAGSDQRGYLRIGITEDGYNISKYVSLADAYGPPPTGDSDVAHIPSTNAGLADDLRRVAFGGTVDSPVTIPVASNILGQALSAGLAPLAQNPNNTAEAATTGNTQAAAPDVFQHLQRHHAFVVSDNPFYKSLHTNTAGEGAFNSSFSAQLTELGLTVDNTRIAAAADQPYNRFSLAENESFRVLTLASARNLDNPEGYVVLRFDREENTMQYAVLDREEYAALSADGSVGFRDLERRYESDGAFRNNFSEARPLDRPNGAEDFDQNAGLFVEALQETARTTNAWNAEERRRAALQQAQTAQPETPAA